MAKTTEPKFLISYKYANPAGEIRTKQILISATDIEGAKKKASEMLALSYDWSRLGSVTPA